MSKDKMYYSKGVDDEGRDMAEMSVILRVYEHIVLNVWFDQGHVEPSTLMRRIREIHGVKEVLRVE